MSPPRTSGPTLGLTALFDDEDAAKRIDKHLQRIQKLEAAQKKLEDRVDQSSKRNEENTKRSTSSIIQQMRKWRYELITLRFFIQLLSRAVKTAWEAMDEAAQNAVSRGATRALAKSYEVDLGGVAAQLRDVADGTLSVQDSIAAVQAGILQDQGQFVNAYAQLWEAARVAAASAGGDVVDHFETFVEALAMGDAEIIDQQTNMYQARLALQKYAESIGTTVEELDPMVKSEILLGTVLDTTNQLLAEGAGAALSQATSIESVKSAWADYKSAAGAALKTSFELAGGFEFLEYAVTTLGQSLVIGVAWLSKWSEIYRSVISGEGFTAGQARGQARFDEIMKQAADALGLFRDEVDATQFTYERFVETPETNIDPIIDHLLKRQDLIEEHDHRVEKIERQHADKLEDIEIDYQNSVARIHRKAIQDENRAERKYLLDVENATERHYIDEAQALSDHVLKMAQMWDDYYRKRLQDQRMYEYERGLLVAYGDVLAIEDLDARFALEQQANQENIQAKTRQEQDDYENAHQDRDEDFDQRLKELEKAYDEQLQEIRIRMQEQLLEESIQRQEAIRQAIRDYERRLEEEQYMHDRELEQWRQHWEKIQRQTEIAAQDISEIIQQYFGEGSVATQTIDDFIARYEEVARIKGIIQDVVGSLGGTSETITRSYGQWSTTWNDPRRSRGYTGYQHGGSGIAYRPTPIMIGETPERFSVTPIVAENSRITIGWGGNAIPVQGGGSLAGVDLSSVGDAIAQGLVIGLTERIAGKRT